jgi:hypothetical protein
LWGGRGRGGEYSVKNMVVSLVDVLCGLRVQHFQTSQETNTNEIKNFHLVTQYETIPNILSYTNNTKGKMLSKWHFA